MVGVLNHSNSHQFAMLGPLSISNRINKAVKEGGPG
jgi:hypothetical protein